MISFQQPLPAPADSTVAMAIGLLVAMTDIAGTKARLDETLAQIAALHAAYAEAVAARDAAVAEQGKLTDLVEREKLLADKQAQADAARLQNDTAAAALRDREQKVGAQELAITKARDEIAADRKALENKRQSMRAALAG